MPTITISEIMGNLMIIAGDIFILLGMTSAVMALFWAVLGKWSIKVKQEKYDLRFGLVTIFIFIFNLMLFYGKWRTEDLAGLQNGLFFGFSDILSIFLMVGIVLLLAVTAVISFSDKMKVVQ